MAKGPVPPGHSWILKQNLMVSANSEPTSEIVPAPFLPALLKFGHRCDGTGAVSGRQSHEKTVRRRARAAFFCWSLDRLHADSKQAIAIGTVFGLTGYSSVSRPPISTQPPTASVAAPRWGRFLLAALTAPGPDECLASHGVAFARALREVQRGSGCWPRRASAVAVAGIFGPGFVPLP
jgi:hypothetical protein